MIDDVKIALQFLTRLPIHATASKGMADLARACWAFPLAGLVVGVAASLIYLLCRILALPDLVAVILAVSTTIIVTGALHEDGLADTFDALGGHAKRERALEIMRDSRIGTYGTLALIIVVALRVGALASLGDPAETVIALIAAACLSRSAMALAMQMQGPARIDGLGAGAGKTNKTPAATAFVIGVAVAMSTGSIAAVLLLSLASLLAATLMTWWTRRRLGGFTGDTIGAIQQLADVACLVVLAGFWS